jgi:quercetin dioxygenase-like cupin family protein
MQDVPPVRDEPGLRQAVFRGLDQMLAFTVVGPDKEDDPPHTHAWEQMNTLLEGELDFLVDGERITLQQYDTMVIPPGVPHASRAVSDEPATLLAFWPLREDRLAATDYQTEFDTE